MREMYEYESNLLGIDEFHSQSSSRLRFWYKHIRENARKDDGDIFEFGIYRGSSLIAAALILKELNSSKKVYGFDSFKGFPSFSPYDDLNSFYKYKGKYFSVEFIEKFENFMKVKEYVIGKKKLDPVSLDSAGDHSGTTYEMLMRKIDYFGLDNIEIIQGSFEDTVSDFFGSGKFKISSCNMDCDLYDGYNVTLPYVYENLSKNGYIHLDEYFSFKYPGARIACDDFFKTKNIKPVKNKNRDGEFERWYLTK